MLKGKRRESGFCREMYGQKRNDERCSLPSYEQREWRERQRAKKKNEWARWTMHFKNKSEPKKKRKFDWKS